MKNKVMKINASIIILITLCFQCQSIETKEERFNKYISSLDKVEFPFQYSSKEFPYTVDREKAYDEKSFKEFGQAWAVIPFGLLYKDEEKVITADLILGDLGFSPYLMSYDSWGRKIDSLNAFSKAGFDMGYIGHEYITVDEKLNVGVIDSVWAYKINALHGICQRTKVLNSFCT